MKFCYIFICISVIKATFSYADVVCPKSLRPGDTVGLIASASTVEDKNEIWNAKANLEKLGFKVILGKHIFDGYDRSAKGSYFSKIPDLLKSENSNLYINLAGNDEDRARDIMSMFESRDIKAIVEFRGGYGSGRLLRLLDYDTIRKNPKIIVGYSDITALLLAINSKTGLVTFHGPMARESWNDFTKRYFFKVLTNDSNGLVLNEYFPVVDDSKNISNLQFTINGGEATGKMLGGNLSVLTSIVGSPYLPDFSHSILFVEDVSETQLYKLDRMFSQLENAGILSKISGFIFASCYGCSLSSTGYIALRQMLDRYIKPLGIPAYAGSMIGHFGSIFTVPIGMNVQINADKYEIKFLQSATINK